MSKRFLRVVSLMCAVLMLFSLVACGGGNTAGTKKEDGKAAEASKTAEPAKSGGKAGGQIEFWSVFTGPDGTSMQKMVDEYNKTNPKMKVVHRPIQADDLYQKIPSMIASGKNIPELCINHVERLPLFVEKGVLTPLDDYIAKNGKIKTENYVKTAWDMSTINGKHYGIPLDVHSFPMYYNIDLLKKYGMEKVVEDNKVTFDEVKQVAEVAKKDGIKGIGVTWMRVLFLGWLAQAGGTLSEDGTNPSFANEKGIKALQTFKDLHDAGITTKEGDDSIQLFKAGKLVFLPEGIWMKNGLEEVKTLNWGMTHVASFDTSNVYNWTSSHQIVMLKNPAMTDEKASAAMDFLAWVADNSLEWAKAGQNPASLKILENEEFKKMKHGFLLKESETLKIFNYKYYGYAVEALDKIVTDAIYGKIDIKEGLEKAQKETQDRIKAGK